MTLPEFIQVIGVKAAAKLFDVSFWTARSWLRGVKPKPSKAPDIVLLSGGRVTFEGIYGRTK